MPIKKMDDNNNNINNKKLYRKSTVVRKRRARARGKLSFIDCSKDEDNVNPTVVELSFVSPMPMAVTSGDWQL
jgi:hypothetical protein